MIKKWFGASLLVFVLALAGCSEEKAKPEEKPKAEEAEKGSNSNNIAEEQARVIKNMEKNAVELDPKALEEDPKAYEQKIIKATGTVDSDVEKGMGGSFELKVGETNFKVMNFTLNTDVNTGDQITVYGNVKNGKDTKSGLSLINATYID
ncbi:hypothetical protein KUV80_11830 [Fictibacillus nanhaiensis]|uniref:hypothetical protein n=1 Tax=Fictibacillus nanhaiensis TaxID=742169 RepID=UPI001C970491|nr:hypothetical protein [Fictibacillus nanhaiensis]MBY6037352.1 hypothetical protein [Fictibacillus nanhaiensis]